MKAHGAELIPMLALALALTLAGCGAKGAGGVQGLPEMPIPPVAEQDVVAEVLAARAPDGVGPALWGKLTHELAGELQKRSASATKELDIGWWPFSDGVGWDNAFMRADGSDNGVVDIGDLVPIAMYYGEDVSHTGHHGRYDYNLDGYIDIRDITPIALSYGLACSGFRVEFSGTSAESGFSFVEDVNYSGYDRRSGSRRIYRVRCDTWEGGALWVRVKAFDRRGSEIGSCVFQPWIGGGGTPLGTVWVEILQVQPPSITWSTAFLIPDGNQDGVVDWFDAGYTCEFMGTLVSDQPRFGAADYDGDGVLSVADITPIAMHIFESVGQFRVEVTTDWDSGDWVAEGTIDYSDSTSFNEFGFRYYEYEIASPPLGPFWVRVVPYGLGDLPGTPSNAVSFGGE